MASFRTSLKHLKVLVFLDSVKLQSDGKIIGGDRIEYYHQGRGTRVDRMCREDMVSVCTIKKLRTEENNEV